METDREPPSASVRAIIQWLRDHGYAGEGGDPAPAPSDRLVERSDHPAVTFDGPDP